MLPAAPSKARIDFHRLKRIIISSIIVLFLLVLLSESVEADIYEDIYGEVIESFEDDVPDSVEANNSEISFTDRLLSVLTGAKDYFSESFSVLKSGCISVLCILFVGSVAKSLLGEKSGTTAFNLAIAVGAFVSLYSALSRFIGQASDTVISLGSFCIGFIPAFAGIAAAGGQVTSSMMYSATLIAVINIFSQVIMRVIVPVISVYLSMRLAAAVSGNTAISDSMQVIVKLIKWSLALVCILFSIVTSVQTVIETAADSIGVRAGRLFVAGGVPVVGGRIADSVGTVFNSMKAVKGGVGAVGIVSLVSLILPSAVRYVVFTVVCFALGAASRLLGQNSAAEIVAGMRECGDILFACVTVLFTMITFSTAVLTATGI